MWISGITTFKSLSSSDTHTHTHTRGFSLHTCNPHPDQDRQTSGVENSLYLNIP